MYSPREPLENVSSGFQDTGRDAGTVQKHNVLSVIDRMGHKKIK